MGTEVGEVGVEPSLVCCGGCGGGERHRGAGRILLPQEKFEEVKHLLEKEILQVVDSLYSV